MKSRFAIFLIAFVTLGTTFTFATRWRLKALQTKLQLRAARYADYTARESQRLDKLRKTLARKRAEATDKNALLRLRAEVSDLRHNTSDVDELRTAIERLNAEIGSTNRFGKDTRPDPSKVRAYWPKDQIAYAGYMDETSAVQSCLWALTRGDMNAVLSAMDPAGLRDLARVSGPAEESEDDKAGTSAAAVAERNGRIEKLAESLAPVTGFYLVSDNILRKMGEVSAGRSADEHAVYKVFFAGEGTTRGIAMTKSLGEWKLTAIYLLGGTEEQPTYEMNLWP